MIDAKFKWELADNTSSATVDNLEKELGISRILATLLAQQGINSTEQAKKFFEPSMEEIHDPTLLHDMDKMQLSESSRQLKSKNKLLFMVIMMPMELLAHP